MLTNPQPAPFATSALQMYSRGTAHLPWKQGLQVQDAWPKASHALQHCFFICTAEVLRTCRGSRACRSRTPGQRRRSRAGRRRTCRLYKKSQGGRPGAPCPAAGPAHPARPPPRQLAPAIHTTSGALKESGMRVARRGVHRCAHQRPANAAEHKTMRVAILRYRGIAVPYLHAVLHPEALRHRHQPVLLSQRRRRVPKHERRVGLRSAMGWAMSGRLTSGMA